jgi:formate dehydrogenase major subunit
MSRRTPWLAELQPEMFAEIDPVLARERGIEDGDWMTIITARAEIEAKAKVTDRMRPLKVEGRVIHQVGLPWHWGYQAPHPGDSTNDLGVISGDPNTSIQESKAFTCDVRAGRRTRPTTAGLAGMSADETVAPNADDHIAEEPKETTA